MIAPPGRLPGRLVSLRPRTREDAGLFVRWFSDPRVRHWLHLSETPLPTLESERVRYEISERDPARLTWIIETGEGEAIGNISLAGIDETHGRAELGVSIGDPAYWGRGYGQDAIRTLLRFAFAELGLRRITLIADADNERGIRCYEKCGFVREGLLRGHRLRHGRPTDMVAMAVMRPDR